MVCVWAPPVEDGESLLRRREWRLLSSWVWHGDLLFRCKQTESSFTVAIHVSVSLDSKCFLAPQNNLEMTNKVVMSSSGSLSTGTSTPPPLPPPAYVHVPLSSYSPLPPPSPRQSSRPPSLSLPRHNAADDELHGTPMYKTPLSSRTPTPTRRQPRTPSLPSPSLLSGPWHGRCPGESPHGYHHDVIPNPLSIPEVEELVFPPGEVNENADKRRLALKRYTSPRFEADSKQVTDSVELNENVQRVSPSLTSSAASTSLTSSAASTSQTSSSEPVQNIQSLEEAVTLGQSTLVDCLLKRGDNPDGGETCKNPPLVVAAALGNEKIVKLLLAAGANINRRDVEQYTALHHAAAASHRGVVKLLLVAGSDMFAKTVEGLLPVDLTRDDRIHQLLLCRMRTGQNVSPRNLASQSDISSSESLSGKESIPGDERLSISSDSDGLESPSSVSLSVQNSSLPSLPPTPTNGKPIQRLLKYIPPTKEDLSFIRKDWHEAALSGCVGCGRETCEGTCLPQTKISEGKKLPAEMSSTDGTFMWTRGELLGEGAYGKVFAGLNQSTGELMAVKQLKIEPAEGQTKASYLASLKREIDIYKQLRHKHIVGYIAMGQDESNDTMYIFLEYVSGGSIQSMLERFGRFNESLVRVYTRQLLLGLEYLHANNIVHRDIKGGNILVDADGVVKLADFGASKVFHDPTVTDACRSIRGSVFWMAPEVIKGDGYGRRADIWSVGCTVIEMLTATHPWPGIDNTWTAIFHIAKASSGPPIPEHASECAKEFLQQCFQLEARSRATAEQLLEHPFVAIDIK